MNDRIIREFPFLRATQVRYFDNAATTQKPKHVIDSIVNYYVYSNANVHRGIHRMSQMASEQYENARKKVAKFINASPDEIVFTSGATESLNIVASSFCKMFKPLRNNAGMSIILTTEMEHHSNIVPFQAFCYSSPADKLMFVEMDAKNGQLDIDGLIKDLNSDGNVVKLVTIAHVSNALGEINDVKKVVGAAHANNIPVCVDGSQSIAHMPIDVKDLGCDFFVFSGHKMYAPMGIGVLYGKKEFMDAMPPFKYGGGMITEVTKKGAEFQEAPFKFEAGTPNVEGAIGLMAAIEFIEAAGGMKKIKEYEDALLNYSLSELNKIRGVRIIGQPQCGIISFIVDGMSNKDVAGKLDRYFIAVRNGLHCTHPLMDKMGAGKDGTIRMSFAVYNTKTEIDYTMEVLKKIVATTNQ